ncbi:MAG TPA: 8-amino-7-oxononanoate synthase [Xanthomonadales bacterium]|nr:8-amino-7-oxononanoate synthase [Xanthomonadales bacterium]
MDPGLEQWLADAADARRQTATQRTRRVLHSDGSVTATLDGRPMVNFSSNDYLGLASHPALAVAATRGAQEYGTGSGASALVTGYREPHAALESELAEFLQREAVLLCASGYHANLAALTSLAGRGDVIVQDRLCHASLIDGARLSGAELRRYPHCDVEGLERQLERGSRGHALVVTDGVFSMDGDTAPLASIAQTCRRHAAWLLVDDAHGIGVAGPGGRGSVAAAKLDPDEAPVLIGTLGKAFGCAGAFIAGSQALVEQIVNAGRSYLFTTALSPALAEAARQALALIREDEWRRTTLAERITRFRAGAAALELPVMDSESPIQPLMVGEAADALAVSDALLERGFLVTAIRPPTVPAGTARLRIALSSEHEEQHVDGLLGALGECLGRA